MGFPWLLTPVIFFAGCKTPMIELITWPRHDMKHPPKAMTAQVRLSQTTIIEDFSSLSGAI